VTHSPPAGGYGSAPPSARFGPAPEAESGDGSRGSLHPLITAAIVVTTLSTALVLVVAGCRRYIGLAKTAEVRNNLALIAKDAAAAYEPAHRVCPSASQPVPATLSTGRASKYMSQHAEWAVDEAKGAGFACLGFEMTSIQYYQYRYDATPSSFTAGGRGDLNGNGVFSDFTWSGHVEAGRLVIDRKVTENVAED
jgi:hypothetical protein